MAIRATAAQPRWNTFATGNFNFASLNASNAAASVLLDYDLRTFAGRGESHALTVALGYSF